jgi:hypothetical protein
LVGTAGTGRQGELDVFTEGRVALDDNSYFIGLSVVARAKGPITLSDNSYFDAPGSGAVDVVSEGAINLAASYFLNNGTPGGPIRVRAKSLTLLRGSTPSSSGAEIITGGVSKPNTAAGAITIDLLGDLELSSNAYIGPGSSICTAGAGVTIRTEGNIVVRERAAIFAGPSVSGNGCSAGAGGDLIILAGGTITASVPANIGPGGAGGTSTVTSSSAYRLGDLNANLTASSTVTSVAFPFAATVLSTSVFRTIPAEWSGARLLLPVGTGTSARSLPARYLPGKSMAPGWRYRVLLEPRMFDDSALDGFEIDYR